MDEEELSLFNRCHHGPKGKCLHCVPVEVRLLVVTKCSSSFREYLCQGHVFNKVLLSFQPYDENYLRSCDPPIKFLSFHAYLRKLTGGVDKCVPENFSEIAGDCRESAYSRFVLMPTFETCTVALAGVFLRSVYLTSIWKHFTNFKGEVRNAGEHQLSDKTWL